MANDAYGMLSIDKKTGRIVGFAIFSEDLSETMGGLRTFARYRFYPSGNGSFSDACRAMWQEMQTQPWNAWLRELCPVSDHCRQAMYTREFAREVMGIEPEIIGETE